jgi:ligand-binding sensor domain-containing protein/two-component sensor histidine kinase
MPRFVSKMSNFYLLNYSSGRGIISFNFVRRMTEAARRVYLSLFSVVCLLLSGLSFNDAYSQRQTLTTYSLSEINGLSDNRVTSIFQDHQGFLWIGTEDGLNRYDGSIFRIYKKKGNDSTQLADNFVTCITEDTEHHLWVGTRNGVSEYDPGTNSFLQRRFNPETNNTNVDEDIVQDRKGTIWIGTHGGLAQWVPSQKRFVLHLNHSGRVSDNRINKILIDQKNRFWVATFDGLWRFYPDDSHFERVQLEGYPIESKEMMITIAEGHDGVLWLGYWGRGIFKWNPETGDTRKIEGIFANIQGITEVVNRQGKYDVWFSNFLRMDENNVVTSFAPGVPAFQENFKAGPLYYSGNGLLFMGTDKGVVIMDPTKQFFHHHYLASIEITHQGISLYEQNDRIYIGGGGNYFLRVYDSSFNQIKNIPMSVESLPTSSIRDPALLSILKEDDHHTWLCTEEGLLLLDEISGKQNLFRITERESSVLTRNFIDNIFIDSHHAHWIFPWRAGIWQFDPVLRTFKKMIDQLSPDGKQKRNLLIGAATEDSNGNIWFADLDEGLIRLDRKSGVYARVKTKLPEDRYGLTNVVYETPYIWCATAGTVFRINEHSMAFEQWLIPEDLNKTITGFCQDRQHNLWIGTRNGLLSFNTLSHTYKRFTVNDGLVNNVMDGTLFCLNSGKMVYADKNYITTFDPRHLVRNSSIPSVLITNVLSQNQVLEIGMKGATKFVDVDYSFNNFTFEWAVLNYRNPFQNRYYCKFEGIDNDWKYAGNTGRVQYASVSPGRHVFRVRGATSDGILNESGDFITVIIHPPFWKSWWFFSSIFLVFMIMVYTLYRYQLGEALKRERMRNHISADLHDEIGSTLSSISIMSDRVVRQTAEVSTSEVAMEIRENTVLLMERMDDIVWSINPKNDSLENLLLRIKRFASHVLEAKGIGYTILIHPDVHEVKLRMEDRQHIYLLLKEAINNLVKYSGCSSATIEVKPNQSWLELIVRDNGKGFDAESEHAGNGIASMKNRAKMMNARLSINSDQRGTVILLELKIK